MKTRLNLLGLGGFSYALNATTQIVTMNTNAKKSYSSIGFAPFQGLGLTAYRIDSTCIDYNIKENAALISAAFFSIKYYRKQTEEVSV